MPDFGIFSFLVPALIGAAIGGFEDKKNPLVGALVGGATGAVLSPGLGAGAAVGSALGVGETAGTGLLGAGVGAASSAATGGNPLIGAVTGGAEGVAGSLLGSAFGGGSGGSSVTGATDTGASTVGTTAPSTPSTSSPIVGSATGSGPVSAAAIAPDLGVSTPSTGISTDLTSQGSVSGAGGGGGSPTGASIGLVNDSPSAVGGGTAPSTSSGGNSFNLTSGQTTGTFDPSLKPDALPNDTSFFGNIKSGINNVADTLGVKPGSLLGAGVSGLGLVKDLATGNSAGNIKGYNELSSQAGALAGQGAQLLSYETNGTLPAGAQANVDQAVAAAQAAIRSKYASMGISGSSAEIQELNQVKQNAVAQQFQIANQLATQGLSQTNTSAEIYKQLLASNQKQAEATSAAVGNLASALASPVSTKTTNNPGALAA